MNVEMDALVSIKTKKNQLTTIIKIKKHQIFTDIVSNSLCFS